MFLQKNKTSITGNNVRSTRSNYGFSCGPRRTSINNSSLLYTKTGNSTSDIFNSLNNQLTNNINTINRNSNSMFPRKKGCGCGGRK